MLFKDVYNLDSDFFPFCPWDASATNSVVVEKYGFLHDVGINIKLIPSTHPTGWNTLRKDFADALREVKNCWDINSDYGYH